MTMSLRQYLYIQAFLYWNVSMDWWEALERRVFGQD